MSDLYLRSNSDKPQILSLRSQEDKISTGQDYEVTLETGVFTLTGYNLGVNMGTGSIFFSGTGTNELCEIEMSDGTRQRALYTVVGNNGSALPYLNVDQPFALKVTQDLVTGHKAVDKFGENPDIDTGTVPEDIWEAGGEYTYDADGTAPIESLVSDDASDTQVIEVTGLDIDGEEVVQNITLTGTTRVALTTPLWRVYRMANIDTTDIAGTVYCYTGTGGVPVLADTRAIIDNGNNQTLMALYTIPKGYVGFLYRGELGGSRSANAGAMQCAYYSRRYGKVFRIKKRVDLTNQGTSIFQDERSFPDTIPALTDIKLRVEDVSANNTGVFGTFDILLIDETEFPDEYLTAIGQPGY